MASCSHPWLFPGMSPPPAASTAASVPSFCKSSKVFASLRQRRKAGSVAPTRTRRCTIRCVKDESLHFDPSKIEAPPYSSYFDSTSGQLEPASGARASIPGQEYWPEGTAARVRAARAPAPVGESAGTPSLGKKPGSRRKGYKEQVASASAADGAETSGDDGEFIVATEVPLDDTLEETNDSLDEYVIYEAPKEESLSEYEMDKMMGRPHPFVDPAKAMLAGEPKSSEELWWNWRRKSETETWSRWQRRRPDVDTVFAKAMAEGGCYKSGGNHPPSQPFDPVLMAVRSRQHSLGLSPLIPIHLMQSNAEQHRLMQSNAAPPPHGTLRRRPRVTGAAVERSIAAPRATGDRCIAAPGATGCCSIATPSTTKKLGRSTDDAPAKLH